MNAPTTPQTAAPIVGQHASSLRASLRADVAIAQRIVPTHYPVQNFIAVNPLGGLEDLPFGKALHRAKELYRATCAPDEQFFRDKFARGRITTDDLLDSLQIYCSDLLAAPPITLNDRQVTVSELLLEDLCHGVAVPTAPDQTSSTGPHRRADRAVDDQASKWCAAFLGADNAGWPMPSRESGFYNAWRTLAVHDRSLSKHNRQILKELPARADDAALRALHALNVKETDKREYLRLQLTRLPGWAGYIRWASQNSHGIDTLDYLAMRLTYQAMFDGEGHATTVAPTERDDHAAPTPQDRVRHLSHLFGAPELDDASTAGHRAAAAILEQFGTHDRGVVWLRAYERHYQRNLLGVLAGAPAPESSPSQPARAQIVCCIDARSEGLRRHLEALGNFDTLGFAGFFAVAIRFNDLAGGSPNDLCPVLIKPGHSVTEHPAPASHVIAARRIAGLNTIAGAEDAFHAAKDTLVTPFALAESAGWFAGPWAALKTLAPRFTGAARSAGHQHTVPHVDTVLDIDAGFTPEQQALYAEAALVTMGLTRNFARSVLLCAHHSTSENNPYQASLDCGACGGQGGGPNARTLAAILNRSTTREALHAKGIIIPESTWFGAAEHDTATDNITILDLTAVPASHREEIEVLASNLRTAGQALATERCASLPGAPARALSPSAISKHVSARSLDWSQVYPEWGLAGNAAFIVGPRSITRGKNLERRAFLHSYDAEVDADGTALETILTAPMVVAQWINCQYYFSSVAPETFGAGTKTIHNVVSGVGVIAGHNGDLQLGLPWQSVAVGNRLVHEPMRLFTLIEAPLERISAIIDRNPTLQQLFGNEWVALVARRGPNDKWNEYSSGEWRHFTAR